MALQTVVRREVTEEALKLTPACLPTEQPKRRPAKLQLAAPHRARERQQVEAARPLEVVAERQKDALLEIGRPSVALLEELVLLEAARQRLAPT